MKLNDSTFGLTFKNLLGFRSLFVIVLSQPGYGGPIGVFGDTVPVKSAVLVKNVAFFRCILNLLSSLGECV